MHHYIFRSIPVFWFFVTGVGWILLTIAFAMYVFHTKEIIFMFVDIVWFFYKRFMDVLSFKRISRTTDKDKQELKFVLVFVSFCSEHRENKLCQFEMRYLQCLLLHKQIKTEDKTLSTIIRDFLVYMLALFVDFFRWIREKKTMNYIKRFWMINDDKRKTIFWAKNGFIHFLKRMCSYKKPINLTKRTKKFLCIQKKKIWNFYFPSFSYFFYLVGSYVVVIKDKLVSYFFRLFKENSYNTKWQVSFRFCIALKVENAVLCEYFARITSLRRLKKKIPF